MQTERLDVTPRLFPTFVHPIICFHLCFFCQEKDFILFLDQTIILSKPNLKPNCYESKIYIYLPNFGEAYLFRQNRIANTKINAVPQNPAHSVPRLNKYIGFHKIFLTFHKSVTINISPTLQISAVIYTYVSPHFYIKQLRKRECIEKRNLREDEQ